MRCGRLQHEGEAGGGGGGPAFDHLGGRHPVEGVVHLHGREPLRVVGEHPRRLHVLGVERAAPLRVVPPRRAYPDLHDDPRPNPPDGNEWLSYFSLVSVIFRSGADPLHRISVDRELGLAESQLVAGEPAGDAVRAAAALRVRSPAWRRLSRPRRAQSSGSTCRAAAANPAVAASPRARPSPIKDWGSTGVCDQALGTTAMTSSRQKNTRLS